MSLVGTRPPTVDEWDKWGNLYFLLDCHVRYSVYR